MYDEYVTPREFWEKCGRQISLEEIRTLCKLGKLPHIKSGTKRKHVKIPFNAAMEQLGNIAYNNMSEGSGEAAAITEESTLPDNVVVLPTSRTEQRLLSVSQYGKKTRKQIEREAQAATNG